MKNYSTNVSEFTKNGETLTKQNLQNKEYLTIGFHEEFQKNFGFSVLEAKNSIPNVNTIKPMYINADYLALLFLNGNLSTWKNISKSHFSLDSDVAHLEDTFAEISKYFSDKNFTRENFTLKNLEIKNYIANKFPKSKILINETREKLKYFY